MDSVHFSKPKAGSSVSSVAENELIGEKEDLAGLPRCDCEHVEDFPEWEKVQRLYRGGLSKLNMSNSVVALCCPKGKPYLREHFRDALEEIVPLRDLVAMGPLRSNNIYELVFSSGVAKSKLLKLREISVNGHLCKLVDPQVHEVACRVFWLPYETSDEEITRAFLNYGVVRSVVRERSNVQRLEACCTNVRRVSLLLRAGICADDIPDMVHISFIPALVAVQNRPPKCLRCLARGHIRKACQAKRCPQCNSIHDGSLPCRNKSFAQVVQDGGQRNGVFDDITVGDSDIEEAVPAQVATSFQTDRQSTEVNPNVMQSIRVDGRDMVVETASNDVIPGEAQGSSSVPAEPSGSETMVAVKRRAKKKKASGKLSPPRGNVKLKVLDVTSRNSFEALQLDADDASEGRLTGFTDESEVSCSVQEQEVLDSLSISVNSQSTGPGGTPPSFSQSSLTLSVSQSCLEPDNLQEIACSQEEMSE